MNQAKELNRPNSQAVQKLTAHARRAILQAEKIAVGFQHPEADCVHLLLGIFLEKGSLGGNILKDLGFTEKLLRQLLAEKPIQKKAGVAKAASSGNARRLSSDLKKAFVKAYSVAQKLNSPYVGTEHLLSSLVNSKNAPVKNLLKKSKIKNINQSLLSFFDSGQLANLAKIFNLPEIKIATGNAKKSSATPFIDKFCSNLNREAKEKQEIIVGREREIERMIHILGRKNKNNPILIGDPGVGKTALISGLARLINSGQVPHSLYRKRLMALDVAQLIAGTSFRGEFEARLKEIIRETKTDTDVILFIDEIHNIIGAGNVSGSLDLANIIKPALARGEIQVIGATTFQEYKKYFEKDAALERRFQPLKIQEPGIEEAKKILSGIREHYENFHNVSISDEAVSLAVELSTRYIQKRFLPDKAIDVIDEAASHLHSKNKVSDFIKQMRRLEDEKIFLLEEKERLVSEENYERAVNLKIREKELEQEIKSLQKKQSFSEKENRLEIQAADIIETVSGISGIPAEKLSQAKTGKIKNIARTLSTQIIGQEEASQKLAHTLIRSQAGVANPDRPMGSFLFLGPTGVGKTLTAKILARGFFDDAKSLIRVDMSELMERHSVSSLIGSPAGYIGYGEGGNLTEKVRHNPYSVILFDEIEKAHPDVSNILLQILEDGTLTDAEGTTVSFKNAVIILTSNIGTGEFTGASQIGFHEKKEALEKFDAIKEKAVKELEQRLKPELINRLDNIIIFNALTGKDIQKITASEIKKLQQRLRGQKIQLTCGKAVANHIAGKSFDPKKGARLVRKNIQDFLENPIAEMIIYDKIIDGKITALIENDSKIKLV